MKPNSPPIHCLFLVGVLLCASACGGSPELGHSSDSGLSHGGQEPASQLWITLSRESLHTLSTRLEAPPLTTGSGDASELVAVPVAAAALPAISLALHEARGRCGGFVTHASEEEALRALRVAEAPQREKLGPDYTIDNGMIVSALLPAVQAENVLSTVRTLSSFSTRFHADVEGRNAALWIRDAWAAIAEGRPDMEVALIEHEGTPQPSVSLTIRGERMPEEQVVLGAHLDSVVYLGRSPGPGPAPGADDNASGVAVLTEIARIVRALQFRPARTVVLYAYAAEEIGLVGSDELAERARAEGKNIVGVLNLDMVNYNSAEVPYIALVRDYTDDALTSFTASLIETYVGVPHRSRVCGYACSDHASWTVRGYPVVAVHEADGEDRNPELHTEADTLALTSDGVAHALHFVRLGLAFVSELAKGELREAPASACITPPCDAPQCDDAACGSPPSSRGDEEGCSLTTDSTPSSRWWLVFGALLLVVRVRVMRARM